MSCEDPVSAHTGSNVIPDASRVFWYRFTPAVSGEVAIRFSALQLAHASLYSGGCDTLHLEASGYGVRNLTLKGAVAGKTYYIEWKSLRWRGFMNFNWQLQTPGGDDCVRAVSAQQGTNTIPATEQHEYWYSFVPKVSGEIKIHQTNFEAGIGRISLYSGECGSLTPEAGSYVELKVNNVVALRKYHIQWVIEGYQEGFEWHLENTSIEPGQNCEQAFTAVVGKNDFPADDEEFWYTYTAAASGKITVSAGTAHNASYVTLYSGSCERLDTLERNYGGIIYQAAKEGETYYIKIIRNDGSDLYWYLSNESSSNPGEDCSLAREASIGNNHLPLTYNPDYWYWFTAVSEGKIAIRIPEDNSVRVGIRSENCSNDQFEQIGLGGLVFNAPIVGKTYFIKLSNIRTGNLNWMLVNAPLGEGDDCNHAVEIDEGIHTLPETANDHYWYSFVADSTGKIKINPNRVYDFFILYSGSCSSPDWLASGAGGTMEFDEAIEGKRYFIKWDILGKGNFNWEIQNTASSTSATVSVLTNEDLRRTESNSLLGSRIDHHDRRTAISNPEDTFFRPELQLYPNPASRYIRLSLAGYDGTYEVIVQNLSGAEVARGNDLSSVDLKALRNGTYTVTVKTREFVTAEKIVVSH